MIVGRGVRKVLERMRPVCSPVSREDALAELTRLDGRKWACLDFETASSVEPRVIEVGLVGSDGEVLMEELVDPRIPITERVTGIHGLQDDDVAGAAAWPEVQGRLAEVLRRNGVEVVVAFNASFEAMCLAYNAEAYGIDGLEVEFVCLQRVALGFIEPDATGWLSLARACDHELVQARPTHRAVLDCLATVELAFRVLGHRGALNPDPSGIL